MNSSGSAPKKQGDSSWIVENCGTDHHRSVHVLEKRQNPTGSRLEWVWDNAMLLSQQHTARRGNEDERGDTVRFTADAIITGQHPRHITSIPTTVPVNASEDTLSSSCLRHFTTRDVGSSGFASSFFQGAYPSNSRLCSIAAKVTHADSDSFLEERRELLSIAGISDRKKEHSGDILKLEADLYPVDSPGSIGLNLGVRTYFATDGTLTSRVVKRPRFNSPGTQAPRCQVDSCETDLRSAKHYHRRHRVCEVHSKAVSAIVGRQTQRFCQQCSRFHLLSEFDDAKRSCRKRLADHNRRRRKPQNLKNSATVSLANSLPLIHQKEDDDKSGNNCSGNQPLPISDSDTQALISTIFQSPSFSLRNAKTQLSIGGSWQEAESDYLHNVGQTGTHLSLCTLGSGVCLEGQNQQNGSYGYHDVMDRPHLWVQSATCMRNDLSDIGIARSLNLPHITSNKTTQSENQGNSSVQASSPSIHSLIPKQSPRDVPNSAWVLHRESLAKFPKSMQRSMEEQRVRSWLEIPSSVTEVKGGRGGQQSGVVEFFQLQHSNSSSNC